MVERRRRVITAFIVTALVAGGTLFSGLHQSKPSPDNNSTVAQTETSTKSSPALKALAQLAIKGRAPKTGYNRDKFGGHWASEGSCSMRDKILARDMVKETFRGNTCLVTSGTLNDPYTGKTISFKRGVGTSNAVQIDHVVAIGDAWQTGAQQLSSARRAQLYSDPLELLAVDGPANEQKSDGDAATWLPANKSYRCRYAARQIAVKLKYKLWMTSAEHDATQHILSSCPKQQLPIVKN